MKFNHSNLKTHTFKKSLLVTGIALALAACGSSNSSDNEVEGEAVGSSSFSGTVADGYLKDARVCLDLNENKVCDDGEPSAISTDGGEFTLDAVTDVQLATYSLVVEVIAGLTEDEDEPGVPIDKAYSMTAPAGYDFVSPLTTMVKQELEENEGDVSFTLEHAEAAIQTKLGTTLDLSEDYVEAKGEDSDFSEQDKQEFEKLHKVAQVTARIMKENIFAVEGAVENTDITFDQVLDMVVGQVLEALQVINNEVDQTIEDGGDFDPDALAESDDITDEVAVDTDSVEDDIAARQAEKQASSANLVDLVATVGINWFEADRDDGELRLSYGSFQHNVSTGASNDSHYYFDDSTGSFVQESREDEYNDYLLTENGWVSAPERETITINADGSITVANAELPDYAQRLDAEQFDITGLNIASTLAQSGHGIAWSEVVDPVQSFSGGALGFKLKFTTLNNQYKMWNWDCDESDVVGGMCNSVWANTGDGDRETNGPATSLSGLISSSANTSSDPGSIKGPQVAWFHNGSVYAEMLSGGEVNYYRVEYHQDGQASVDIVAEGEWSDRTVGEIALIVMELPTNILSDAGIGYEDRFIFFTEKDDYVRRGEYVPVGEVEKGEVVFNVSAKEDVLAAFNGTRFDDTAAQIGERHQEEQLEQEQREQEQDAQEQIEHDSTSSTGEAIGSDEGIAGDDAQEQTEHDGTSSTGEAIGSDESIAGDDASHPDQAHIEDSAGTILSETEGK
jgi:hypothetical protein